MKPQTQADMHALDRLVRRNKLSPPPRRQHTLRRERLQRELNDISARPLTLVCAPVGFGKTELLIHWYEALREQGQHTAWLSLDPGDDEWEVAISSLCESCRIATPAANAASPLRSRNRSALPLRYATELLNALGRTNGDIFLFVDNYEQISDAGTQRLWAYIASHLPDNVHLIVAGRIMPSWPIGTLRLNRALRMVSANDLRFTLEETGAFFAQSALMLNSSRILQLSTSTRGWAAAIRLASVAIASAQDDREIERILAGFNPRLAEYLEETVFAGFSRATRQFLQSTIHLERLTPALCDFVCNGRGSETTLAALEEANVVSRIGDSAFWYEYPAFIRHYLQEELAKPDIAGREILYSRSIEWLTRHGMAREALSLALDTADYDAALAIVEADGRQLAIAGSISVLLKFYDAIPESRIREKPHILYPLLWALVITQRYREADRELRRFDALLEGASDSPDFRPDLLPSEQQLTVLRYRIQQAREPSRTDLWFWQRHRQSLVNSDYRSLEQAELALGWAYLRKDRFGEAFTAFMEARRYAETCHLPVPVTVVTAATHMAEIRKTQGKLHEALKLCNDAIDFAKRDALQNMPVVGVPHLHRSELYYELNRLQQSESDLLQATSLFEHYSHSLYHTQARLHLARLAYHYRGADAALEVLDSADSALCEHSQEYLLEQIRAEQARYYLCKADFSTAEALLRLLKLPVDSRAPKATLKCKQRDQRPYLSMCRYLIATGRSEVASAWLVKLIHQAQSAGKLLFCLELTTLLALAHAREQNDNRTLRSTREMLLYGEAFGAIRRIVDEGDGVMLLIRKYRESQQRLTASQSAPSESYLNLLLNADAGVDFLPHPRPHGNTATGAPSNGKSSLTLRETEILQLIAEGLSNRSISEQLILSEGTVKWHIKNIYNKLGVNSRTQAIVSGRAFGVL